MNRRNFIKVAGAFTLGNLFFGCADIDAKKIPDKEPTEMLSANYDGLFPQHEPLGKGVGVNPGRVVWTYSPQAVNWESGCWWEFKNFDATKIQNMIDDGISALGGDKNPAASWKKLFNYQQGERLAIKINMNGAGWGGLNDEHTNNAFTNPVALRALLISLVEDAKIPADCITVYDTTRNIPDFMKKFCSEGILQNVNFQDSTSTQADKNFPVRWSRNFSGETSYLPTCVTRADYLINFADLKGHSMNGITLTAKNHFGSFINSDRRAAPVVAGLHEFVHAGGMNFYTPLVDLIANYQLGAKTFLYVLDGLIVSPSEGATTLVNSDNTKWFSEPFNGNFTSSLFFSQDPIAIDSVGADFLANEPTLQKYNSVIRNNPNVENYLHEATTASSGTKYLDGNGKSIENLGVHEHWNNCREKKYSRNLGKSEGIELIFLQI